MILPLATAAAYCIPEWTPDPSLAFYIARGWLGCLFAWALWRRWRITGLQVLCVVAWEASSALCGSFFAGIAGSALGALCDAGTGLPITLPSLALTVAACIYKAKEAPHG